MKDIYHVVVTRFSIRIHPEGALRGKSREWLFDKDRLLQKLVLFEHVSLASLAKGSEQPDLLLVLIDKELPDTIRQNLEGIIEPYSWAQTLELDAGALSKMTDLGSLLGDFAIDANYILNTNLDDDDALGADYIRNLKTMVKRHRIERPNQPFQWFGTTDIQEWDILLSQAFPLGFTKYWTGSVHHALSPGYSVLSKNHPSGPNIFLLPHNHCFDILNRKQHRKNYNQMGRFKFRVKLAITALKMGSGKTVLDIIRKTQFATRIDKKWPGQFKALMVNHGDNLQSTRIDRGASLREPCKPEIIHLNFNVNALKIISFFNPE